MANEKERILEAAEKIFLEEGFYKTSMDELALRLRMSKKTIYKNFPSKERLVRDALLRFVKINARGIDEAIGGDASAVEKFYGFVQILAKLASRVKPRVLNDLKARSPELFAELDAYRSKRVLSAFPKILEQGKREGTFEEFRHEVAFGVILGAVREVLTPVYVLANNLTFQEAGPMVFDILMNGLMTDKGRREFRKIKRGEKKK